jgi:rRNA maturation RNase YbeY
MEPILSFEIHEIDFILEQEDAVDSWILLVLSRHGVEVQGITYIFCSDDYLLELNREHLDHDYYTDILTFPLSEPGEPLVADIFISIDRVQENAAEFGTSFRDELHRVMIHGVLHLAGFDDHGEEEARMREREDAALRLRDF